MTDDDAPPTVPVLYIPAISDYAFLLTGISWEWGIVCEYAGGQARVYMD
jgi:hypothetical protein